MPTLAFLPPPLHFPEERKAYFYSFCQKQGLPQGEVDFLQNGSPNLDLLFFDKDGILKLLKKPFSPLFIDFQKFWPAGSLKGPLRHTPMTKALGIKGDYRPVVLDGTCGMGKDSTFMLTFGLRVQAVERSPLVALLLRDALWRVKDQSPLGVREIFESRFSFWEGDVKTLLASPLSDPPDVIYLDPMFQFSRKRKSASCKEMEIFHDWVGADDDAGEVLALALKAAKKRVVVKRPLHGPFLGQRPPSHSYKGRAVRYDMYVV